MASGMMASSSLLWTIVMSILLARTEAMASSFLTLAGIVASSVVASSSLLWTRITYTYPFNMVGHRNSICPTLARQHNIRKCARMYLISKAGSVLVVHGTI